ncbi:MAG: 2,3-bisphosphoglycerate-independent phosphoglycerate mutase [Myxococcales bacterium]|nr:2,3-bisphosphoglycerate-independent phosphoglycerate mutase [Myxococcales bacterium]
MTAWKLRAHPRFEGVPGPVLIVVMDGVGCGRHDDGDAVWLARKPHLDCLAAGDLVCSLRAHGTAVGLPSDDDMGNSEVGHNAFGAGRVFDQGAKRVGAALRSGELFAGAEWKRLTEGVRESGEPMHFIGLLSDGGVHSHIDHLFALIRRCHEENVGAVRVHALLDGRDVPSTSALEYVESLERLLAELRDAGRDYRVASGGGRMTTTMDRYQADWSMVERGWNHQVHGEGRGFRSAREAIETLRREQPGVLDQDLPPFVIVDEGGSPVGPIRDGASVVFFNFRGDRAIEVSRAFEERGFTKFDRGGVPDVRFAGMMQYDGDLHVPEHFLVQPPHIDRTMGEYLAHNQVGQFACSETQKFGHVTYFWNGNRSGMFDEKRERYVEVPSDAVPFEQRPWMKAAEITDATIAALRSGSYRSARINFANGDMVGHTGHLTASVVAVEAIDLCLGRILPVVDALEGAVIVTADHGNCDEMFERDPKTQAFALDADGGRRSKTSHSLNEVPCFIHAPSARGKLRLAHRLPQRGLANVAATALHLMGYERPEGYEPSLLE